MAPGVRPRTGGGGTVLRKPLVGAAVVAAPPLAYHGLIVAQGAHPAVVALAWFATLAGVCGIARLAGLRAPAIVAAAAAVATLWIATSGTRAGLYAAQVATWLALLWLFGRTLAPGREPLVTAIARACHGTLAPEIERYTRGVTLAWCAFFAAIAAALAGLAPLLPLETWSLLANVGAFPAVALVFAAEYAVRRRRFPDFAHVDPIEMVARVGRAGWRGVTGGPR